MIRVGASTEEREEGGRQVLKFAQSIAEGGAAAVVMIEAVAQFSLAQAEPLAALASQADYLAVQIGRHIEANADRPLTARAAAVTGFAQALAAHQSADAVQVMMNALMLLSMHQPHPRAALAFVADQLSAAAQNMPAQIAKDH